MHTCTCICNPILYMCMNLCVSMECVVIYNSIQYLWHCTILNWSCYTKLYACACIQSCTVAVPFKQHTCYNKYNFLILMYRMSEGRSSKVFLTLIFFWKFYHVERWWVSDVRNVKKWGVADFVLERTCLEEHLNLSKSGFVSEEDHSGCKSQNIAIGALKGNVLCQIWFKWTY